MRLVGAIPPSAAKETKALGPKQIAWIKEWIVPAADGAKRVASADANAEKARRMAE
ncbi:MAG: hypothetical protein WA210_00820 [Burkholderiaceae bacterium]